MGFRTGEQESPRLIEGVTVSYSKDKRGLPLRDPDKSTPTPALVDADKRGQTTFLSAIGRL